MVRAFRCYRFKSQTVLPIADEPVALCAAGGSLVYVATTNYAVQGFSLGPSGWRGTATFDTEGLVGELSYSLRGRYLATLETKLTRGGTLTFVKVYLNLNESETTNTCSTRVRIAGQCPKGTLSCAEMEVIEIPLESDPASSISTCPETATLAIAAGRIIHIYTVQDKTLYSNSHTYKDAVQLLEIHWSFMVTKVVVSENYIGCISDGQVQVIRLTFQMLKEQGTLFPKRNAAVHSGASITAAGHETAPSKPDQTNVKMEMKQKHFSPETLISHMSEKPRMEDEIKEVSGGQSLSAKLSRTYAARDDENFVFWNFQDGEKGSAGQSNANSSSKTIFLNYLCKNQNTVRNLPKQVLIIKDDSIFDGVNILEETVLFQECRPNSMWKQLDLFPVYPPDTDKNKWMPMNQHTWPLYSKRNNEQIGMFAFISTLSEGYMYSLAPQSQLLSSYRYTASAVKILPGPNLLTVVTKSGLEMYTSRCGALSIQRTHSFNNIEKALPPVELEPCLCGFQPFIGCIDAGKISNCLIVLSKVQDPSCMDEVVWSIYSLETCSVMDMYCDLTSYTVRCEDSGQQMYLQLLQEAHLILQSHLVLEAGVGPEFQVLFRESSALLGKYYSRPGCADWKLCLPFYNMASMGVNEVVVQALESKHVEDSPVRYSKGLLHYLKVKLFGVEQIQVDNEIQDEILSIFLESAPDYLSSLVLFSQLSGYSSEKALTLMKTVMSREGSKKNYLDHLACSMLYLNLCDPGSAQAELAVVPRRELIEVCVSHHGILHQDFSQLSPMAQLMRKCYPSVLVEALVKLEALDELSFRKTIVLLQGNQHETLHKNTHVKEYLEYLLQDKKRERNFRELSHLLCNIYIKRLMEWEPPSLRTFSSPSKFQMPQGLGHFGMRYSWLDYLPPFHGPKSLKQPCLYLKLSKTSKTESVKGLCSCCYCNEDLLMLQSLLCSDYATETLFQIVEIQMIDNESIHGQESLNLLCVVTRDLSEGIDAILLKYPRVLPQFVANMLDSNPDQWRLVVEKIRNVLQEENKMTDTHQTVFEEVLSKMVSRVTTEDFIRLVPQDGSFQFLLPYIQQCHKRDQLQQLRQVIIAKGLAY